MATVNNTISMNIIANSKNAEVGIKKIGGLLRGISNESAKSGGALGKIADSTTISAFKDMADMLAEVGGKVKDFGMSAIETAGQWQAINAQWSQVWGDMESQAEESINKIGKDTSILPTRLKPAMLSIGAFAKTAGMDTKSSLDLASRAMIATADSAAFYDRSIDDVTESLKSYLKGNYENDAALGISSTETTRNTKANELYGKSFKDLSESQKQLTLLQMVEDGNKLSGALGQASREGDGLENVLGNLKEAQEQFKKALGDVVLDKYIKSMQGFTKVVQDLTTKFQELPQGTKETIVMIGTLLALLPAVGLAIGVVVKGFSIFSGLLSPMTLVLVGVGIAINAVVQHFGGWQTVIGVLSDKLNEFMPTIKKHFDDIKTKAQEVYTGLKQAFDNPDLMNKLALLASAIAGVFLALKAYQLVSGVIGFFTTLSTIIGAMGGVLTALSGVIAVVLSPIGLLVAGIGAIAGAFIYAYNTSESFRNKVNEVFNAIWLFIQPIVTLIKDFILAGWNAISEWWDTNGATMLTTVMTTWESIKTSVMSVIDAVVETVSWGLNQIGKWWEQNKAWIEPLVKVMWETIKFIFVNTLSNILNTVKLVFDTIMTVIDTVMGIVSGIIKTILAVIRGDWDGAFKGYKQIVDSVFGGIKGIVSNVMNYFSNTVSSTINNVTGFFNQLGNIDLWSAGKAIIDGFVNGLKSAWDAGMDFIGGIADWIAENKGPISYDKVLLIPAGNAIMNGLNAGLQNGFKKVKSTVGGMAGELQDTLGTNINGTMSLTGDSTIKSATQDMLSNGMNLQTSSPVVINIGTVDSDQRIRQLTTAIERQMEVNYQGTNQFS